MKKKYIVILSLVVVLIVIRLILPSQVKKYVNKTLADLEGYSGSVEDINLALIRGAYVIKELKIVKTGDSIPVPFVDVKRIDLSIHWKALFNGAIAGEVIFDSPTLNFAVAGSGEKVKQDGGNADWLEALDDLMPLQINLLTINNGNISYKDFTTKPQVNIFLNNLNVKATNLSNVKNKSVKLPSELHADATSLGNGHLNIAAKLNLLKEIPDFDIDLTFEDVDMTALNDFIQAYTKTDVEQGTFNLYAEMAADDAKLDGYVKPVIENLKVAEWTKEEGNFFQKVWESVVGFFAGVFENKQKKQLATKVPIHGDLSKMLDYGVWTAVGNVFKNAFIEAFTKQIEGTVSIKKLEDRVHEISQDKKKK